MQSFLHNVGVLTSLITSKELFWVAFPATADLAACSWMAWGEDSLSSIFPPSYFSDSFGSAQNSFPTEHLLTSVICWSQSASADLSDFPKSYSV